MEGGKVLKRAHTYTPSGSCNIRCLLIAESGRGFVPEHCSNISSTSLTSFRASWSANRKEDTHIHTDTPHVYHTVSIVGVS